MVGSRVANSMSEVKTSLDWVKAFSNVLLPALVYPTRATTGTPSCRRLRLCDERCRRTGHTKDEEEEE